MGRTLAILKVLVSSNRLCLNKANTIIRSILLNTQQQLAKIDTADSCYIISKLIFPHPDMWPLNSAGYFASHLHVCRHSRDFQFSQLFSVLCLHYIIVCHSYLHYNIKLILILLTRLNYMVIQICMSSLFCISILHLLLGCLCYRVRCRLTQHKLFLYHFALGLHIFNSIVVYGYLIMSFLFGIIIIKRMLHLFMRCSCYRVRCHLYCYSNTHYFCIIFALYNFNSIKLHGYSKI